MIVYGPKDVYVDREEEDEVVEVIGVDSPVPSFLPTNFPTSLSL